MNDVARIRNGLLIIIRRSNKKSNMLQDKRINRVFHDMTAMYSAYNRLQFRSAVSPFVGAHAEAFRQTDDSNSSSNGGARTRRLRRQQRP